MSPAARRRSRPGDAEAVQWFVDCVLRASKYPDGFPREYQLAYRPEQREIAVDYELPPRLVVPSARAYRYVKPRDVIESVPRAESEISQCHERLVSCVALRTLHEIFTATPPDVVRAIAFTGRVSTVDRATGKPLRRRAAQRLGAAVVLRRPGPGRGRPGGVPRPSGRGLALGVAFGSFQRVHQLVQGFQVAAGFAGQRRPVPAIELAGHAVVPVLRGLVPGVVEQAELLIAVPVRSANHVG